MSLVRNVLLFYVALSLCVGPLMAEDSKIIDSISIDSIDNVINTSIKKGDKVVAMQSTIEKGKMLYYKGLYANALMVFDNAIKLSDNGKDTLKRPEIGNLYMDCLGFKSSTCSYLSRYEEAVECAIMLDKYNVRNDISYKAKFYNSMGISFAMSGKLEQASEYYRQALAYAKKQEDTEGKDVRIFSICSNLASLFSIKSEFDSAQIYITEAQRLAVYIQDKKKELVCLNLLGTMNANMGRYELAINYYNEAYKLSLECKDYYMLAFLKSHLAMCYFRLGNYQTALKLAFEGLKLAKDTKMKRNEISIMNTLSMIYKDMGDINSAFRYLESSNKMKDSLFSQENEDKFLRQKTDFDMYRVSMEREMMERNLELQESRRIIDNQLMLMVVIVLVMISIFLTYRMVKQRRINKRLKRDRELDVDNMERERQQLKGEIEKKDRVISTKDISLMHKGEQSTLVMAKLKALKTNFPLKGKGFETIKEIEDLVAQMSVDNYYDGINYYLEQVATEFYDKLDILYPELTPSDKKICALMSLGLSTKDITNITGKTRGAIDNVKSRIRMKINVDAGVDLTDFFFRIRI